MPPEACPAPRASPKDDNSLHHPVVVDPHNLLDVMATTPRSHESFSSYSKLRRYSCMSMACAMPSTSTSQIARRGAFDIV